MGLRAVGVQGFQQGLYPLQLQSGAEADGEKLPLFDKAPEVFLCDGAALQIILQQRLVAQGRRLGEALPGLGKIHTAAAELLPQIGKDLLLVRPIQVHFVHEEEQGDPVLFQQLPQGLGVGLDPVGPADDQHGAVQHRQYPLRLRAEVHVPRGIHQSHRPGLCLQPGLLGEDRDPPLPLQPVRIQVSVPMVHPPQHPPGPGPIEHRLRQGGLPRVHMGQQPHTQGGFGFFQFFGHRKAPFRALFLIIA